jgi:ligand-binding sensor domain-containing protein
VTRRSRHNGSLFGFIAVAALAFSLSACSPTATPRPAATPTAGRSTLSPSLVQPTPVPTAIPPSPTLPATATPLPLAPTPLPPTVGPTLTPYPKSPADWTAYSNLNTISGLAFDGQGYLWVASSSGATRWDVQDPAHITYTVKQELTGRRVNAVAIGPDDSAWFATTDGVFRLDGETWTLYGWDDGLGTDWIQTVAVTPDGTVWAGTLRSGVSRFEGDHWTTYTTADGLVDSSVRAIAMAPDGAYWFGTCALWGPASAEPPRCYGVSRFDPASPEAEAWTTYSEADGLAYNRVNDIAVAPDGALWFATIPLSWEPEDVGKGGVSRFDPASPKTTAWTTYTTTHGLAGDGQSWTTYTKQDGLASNEVTALAVAPDGTLWIGTTSGLSRFDGTAWESYTLPGPAANTVMAIAAAPDGSLWFGSGQPAPDSTGRGVTRFDPASPEAENWTTYTEKDGLAYNTVLAVAVEADGTVWFSASDQGYVAKGVSRFDGQTWETLTTADGLASDDVSTIATAPDGSVWFGTSSGVSHLDGQTWTTYTREDGLPGDSISAMAVAPDGTVWLGSWGQGAAWFDGQEWRQLRSIGGSSVTAIAVAPDGTAWFGTYGAGVASYDGQEWAYYDMADGLIDDYVNAIAVAPDGAVWFGTNSGASRFDGQAWTRFTRADGLIDDWVATIIVAPDGALWFGTYNGVARYLPSR